MMLFPFRSIRALVAVVAAASVGLSGCADGGWGASGAAGTAIRPAAETPAARGPFVAAANPLAVEAGLAVLRRGGSAVDAAVAIQAVLGLVEPQSSGLGGGAFMMVFDAASGIRV